MRLALTFILFFISGAAALVYEVTWARSLGLLFGASHLAVATVLAVYMGGQALGSALFGGRAERTRRPLRLYGALEVGIGLSAIAFLGLMKLYPHLYVPVARAIEGGNVSLTLLRTAFAVAAMIVPTTLMGGTLPVLTRYVVRGGARAPRQLSLLYALNTFGAVAGTLVAGFALLRAFGVTTTLLAAAATSIAVGVAAILLDLRSETSEPAGALDRREPASAPGTPRERGELALRLTLLGIGVSGFCALGYEVLWTRMLSLVLGTSVYSFTIMLAAFLTGIGLGSNAFALLARSRRLEAGTRGSVFLFAGTQVAIGVSALAVTVLMRDLPGLANLLQDALVGVTNLEFSARLGASTAIAFAFMFVPAFFMGLAFPASGAVLLAARGDAARTVGRLLAVNTIGAILGSLVSGFALIQLFGIERSLQMLVVVNVAAGLTVAASAAAPRWTVATVPALAVLLLAARAADPGWGRAWDQKFFAAYSNNIGTADTSEVMRQKLKHVDVLYYHEGVNETVSVVRVRGSVQTYIVNGRAEASTSPLDVQLQRTLGHVPMLLHPNPRSAFVLGTGTGMTLGAISVHPELERLVLGEIEEGMLGVARTFERWNHRVLDDPKLEVVLDDGRNFLATTRERFDVISADPTHPWSGGAGYLYTREYFRSVADRLAPGGIACQWLPLYELTVDDVKTVVRTFSESFEHVLIWKTSYDTALIGSNTPIVIDEAVLERRLAVPEIREDLAPLHMTTAQDLLSFFLAGTTGVRAFARDGGLNTDDNLRLEFSAPASQGVGGLDAVNLHALASARESLLPYLRKPESETDARLQRERWDRHLEVSRILDEAHAKYIADPASPSPEIDGLFAIVQATDPGNAPLRFLLEDRAYHERRRPALVDELALHVRSAEGAPSALRISAVRQFLGRERVLVSFVDRDRRKLYGEQFVDGEYERLELDVATYVANKFAALRAAAARISSHSAGSLPTHADVEAVLREEAARLAGQTGSPATL